MRNGIGHIRKQHVARRLLQLAGTHLRIQRDFDVHLIIRTVHAGAVVDEVGVDPATAQCVANTPRLRDAKVGPFADDLCLHIRAIDADRIIARIADIQMAFASVLNIGANPAKPHQLHRRLQYCRHQCRWFNIFRINAQ